MTDDFTQYKEFQFYAGKPTTATPTELCWDGHDYSLSVREVDYDVIVATMASGNCKWTTSVDKNDFVASVNAALEDACDLGRIANYSRDPER